MRRGGEIELVLRVLTCCDFCEAVSDEKDDVNQKSVCCALNFKVAEQGVGPE